MCKFSSLELYFPPRIGVAGAYYMVKGIYYKPRAKYDYKPDDGV